MEKLFNSFFEENKELFGDKSCDLEWARLSTKDICTDAIPEGIKKLLSQLDTNVKSVVVSTSAQNAHINGKRMTSLTTHLLGIYGKLFS